VGENRVENANQRAVGVEMNGHVWDGARWVPAPRLAAMPERPTMAGSPRPQASGANPPHLQMWQRVPQPGFSDPHYGYGFTRQTSDDLQFIVRFYKIMIIIWIVSHVLALVLLPLVFGSMLAAIGSVLPHAQR